MKQKKRLSSGTWLILFLVTALLLASTVPLLNWGVDPYGAFGDRLMQWWSYDETLNPRMAKISYLEQHGDAYDSFIIGSSGSSSIPVRELNDYLDARFYICMFYGTETETFEQTANYLLDNRRPKNLVLNLSLGCAFHYRANADGLSNRTHWRVSGESPLGFYASYLFIDPMESIEKLRRRAQNGYLQEAYKVFDPETGAYDKSKRDAEPIGSLEAYLSREAYAVFRNYPQHSYRLHFIAEAAEAVGRIKARCEAEGVRLIVLCQPTYCDNLAYYTEEDQAAFFNALAQVTDYWDFTFSSVSFEPRYFYDATHARNAVGTMELARVFGNADVYVPEDFGRYVKQGDTPGAPAAAAAEEASYTATLPILCYHHLIEEGECNSSTVTVASFRAQLDALAAAGYTPVSLAQVRAYVEQGEALPEQPILLTFDDGYESNYTLAWPILKKYGFPATIFVIGVSIGKDSYKDTGEAMTPHFSLEQAAEMEASGLITVASHGYDVHEVEGRDAEPIRKGVLQRAGESETDYVSFLTGDAQRMFELLGEDAGFFAYPYGMYDERARVILREAGVYGTVLIGGSTSNVLIKGLPQCLYDMQRYSVYNDVTGEALLAMLEAGS